jgi:hypothetical protein
MSVSINGYLGNDPAGGRLLEGRLKSCGEAVCVKEEGVDLFRMGMEVMKASSGRYWE